MSGDYGECEECGRKLPTAEMIPTGLEDDGDQVIQLWICHDCAAFIEGPDLPAEDKP